MERFTTLKQGDREYLVTMKGRIGFVSPLAATVF